MPDRSPPCRIAVEGVAPDVDRGRFAVKRVVGDDVCVEADIFADGHDELACVLQHDDGGRGGEERRRSRWNEVPMEPLGNDRWTASFPVRRTGTYRYRIVAWIDVAGTWARDLLRKHGAGHDVALDLEEGARLAEAAAQRTRGRDAESLVRWAAQLRRGGRGATSPDALARFAALARRHADRSRAVCHDGLSPVRVDPPIAGCSAWYELFPRSASPDPGRAGTLADVAARLPYVAELGFDVLYLPPIHPIGRTHRKGPDNTPAAGPGDPGSPWAIGAEEGGHTAVHPELGTSDGLARLARAARAHGIELALDVAFQCSPDHPWVREHPEWFRHRPDGSIRSAENPPKRYEDIFPIDFDTEAWPDLWDALLGVVRHWTGCGVRVFRVDNPHTKPFPFWEWLIARTHEEQPDVVFLSEAFTRPKVMHRLAKVGFSQSYTYFTWRNSKQELADYLTELAHGPGREYFRPNLWPNTPDILHESLQQGSRGTFMARLALAAFGAANYGVYGPAFELMERRPREPGTEEYLHSEKYEVRHWDLDAPHSLRHYVARVNAIRRAHPALRRNDTLRLHTVDNDRLLCFSKRSLDGYDTIVVVVNLDPRHVQSGWVDLDLGTLGLVAGQPFEVHDLLVDARYRWEGARNYVELDPASVPVHVFAVEAR